MGRLTQPAVRPLEQSASPPSLWPWRQSSRSATGSLDPNISFQREICAMPPGGHGIIPRAVESARNVSVSPARARGATLTQSPSRPTGSRGPATSATDGTGCLPAAGDDESNQDDDRATHQFLPRKYVSHLGGLVKLLFRISTSSLSREFGLMSS